MKKTLFYFLFYFSFWSLLSFYQPLYAQALDPLLPDIVINDFSGNIKPQQMNPWISSNRHGRSVIAWIDKRELKPAIYAQIFAEDGAPVGPNIRLTGDSVFDVIKTPAGAMDNEGNFVVTWIGIKDRFHAKDNVYFRRFLSDGSPAGSTILVHNLDGDICAFPDIVMNPGGGFVITWEGPTYYCGLDVLAQRFSKDGIPLGNNFRVADDTTKEVMQEIPSISGDNQGNFVISWIGTNKSTFGTYAQLFSSDGSRLGSNIKVNDNISLPTWTRADISFDSGGNFIVVWTGKDRHIYGQRFDNYGQRTTAQNFEVAAEDMSSKKDLTKLGVAASDSGNFMVTWPWDPTDLSDRTVCARLFYDDSSPAGDPFIILRWKDSNSQDYPGVTPTGDGNFIFTWSEADSFLHDIYYEDICRQTFSNKGEPLDAGGKINDDSLSSADQSHPSLILNENGEFTVAWQDYRNGNPDIYVQAFSKQGIPIGIPSTVENDSRIQNYAPEVANSQSGNYVITWLGRGASNYDWDVYAQRLTADGRPQGEILKANEDSIHIRFIQSSLSVAMDSMGNIIIAWSQPVNTIHGKIFGQRFTNMGTPVGPNFIVNADSTEADHWSPSVAMWPDGQSVFAWCDTRDGNFTIYAQLYASNGQKKGDNFQVRSGNEYSCYFPNLAIAPSGDFLICWYEFNQVESTLNLVMQRFSISGEKVDSLVRISDRQAYINANLRKPGIAFNKEGDFVIVWESGKGGEDIWEMTGQRFAADGTLIGKNFPIATGSSRMPHSPDVKLQGDNIYCVWQDNQGTPSGFNTGYDVFANILDFDTPVSIDDKTPNVLPGSFGLEQNFPNPFNPSTTIGYRLASPAKLQITIFDLLGRKIRLLRNEKQPAGSYEILWDGTDDQGIPVASGIYIYRLKAGNYVKSHKMILIR